MALWSHSNARSNRVDGRVKHDHDYDLGAVGPTGQQCVNHDHDDLLIIRLSNPADDAPREVQVVGRLSIVDGWPAGAARDTARAMDDRSFESWRAEAAAAPLYRPLLEDAPIVLGRLAQSLDGRIATASRQSRWISGPEDIRHTHRLRALFDAVLVGAGTVAADDPRLTTRLVDGPSPVRVIIDPTCRLPPHHQVFCDGSPTLLACCGDAVPGPRGSGELLRIPAAGESGEIDPRALLEALAARGLRRIMIEGGGITVSRFLAAGLLDRLHVTIAPLLLGSGVPSFSLPEVATPDDALRLRWTLHRLGDDLLADIPLRPHG